LGPIRHHRAAGRGATAAVALALVVSAAACSGDDDDGGSGKARADGSGSSTTTEAVRLPAGYEGYESENYAGDAHWLCKPGLADDPCSRDLDATMVEADGSTQLQRHAAAEDPAIDCFYVYPTISADPGVNSDFEPAEGQEIATAYNQVARLNSSCRILAPVYRQVTLGGIGGSATRAPGTDPRAVAYGDVVDAFKDYIANESDGRGFVLIGHSQGAGLLTRLIEDEIDDEPLLRDRPVAAYLLGTSVAVPDGEVVGGDFQNVPLCQKDGETGCVVSYASFRSTVPPPADSFFGRTRGDGRAACVNPADLSGGAAQLHPYFLVDQPAGSLLGGRGAQPFADPKRTSEIKTPWVSYPEFVEARCVTKGDHTYLELTVESDEGDPRTDDIGGDLSPQWGMHLIDANVAMGDIESLVASQAKAYAG
jgi:Protein of unknown function (DUF3089)